MTTAAQLRRAGAYVPPGIPDHEPWPPPTHEISAMAVYTVAQAAVLLGLHEKTVLRKIRLGFIKARGPHYRILGAALVEYLQGGGL